MKKIALALVLFFYSVSAVPCTVFQIPGKNPVYGRTFDWMAGHGMALVNLKGLRKTALLLDPSVAQPLEWTSDYGSVTFNQVSREFPFGGINEKGLVIEILWLDESDYPDVDKRSPSINESQWIQYLLDTAANTEEALKRLTAIQVQPGFATVHYMICDAQGACATIEFIGKKLVAHIGRSLPFAVLTNNTYAESLKYLKGFDGFGGNKKITATGRSLDRFAVAAEGVRRTSAAQATVERATSIIEKVKASDTVWKVAYQNQKITFSTNVNRSQREIDLRRLDFSCKTGRSLYLDLHKKISGRDGNGFLVELTSADNLAYLNKSAYLPKPIIGMIDRFVSAGFPCVL